MEIGPGFLGAQMNLPRGLKFVIAVPDHVAESISKSDDPSARRRRNQYPGYGFRLVGSPGYKRRVVDEQERRVMGRIVELRNLGKSWEEIALELLRAKVIARTGQEWSASRVRRAYFA